MKHDSQQPDWIQQVQARGLDGALYTALDVLEPLGPLGAQLVWMAQPLFGLWIPRETMQHLAETLEKPGGFELLRQQLDDQDFSSTPPPAPSP